MATQSFTGDGYSKKFYLPVSEELVVAVSSVKVAGVSVSFWSKGIEVYLDSAPAALSSVVVTYNTEPSLSTGGTGSGTETTSSTSLSTIGQPTDIDQWTSSLLFTAAEAGVTSIYWPSVIETTGRIEGALGKYYLYFSTDHDSTLGGVYMAYSDSPKGPFTHQGLVWRDTATTTGGTPQTETPSVIWDEANSRLCMYYQNQGAQYAGGNAKGSQSTLMATSTDGLSWTKDNNFIIDIPFYTTQIGDGHTGYFRPFQTKRGWFAYSLYGGTSGSACLLWNCRTIFGGQLVGSTYSNGWVSDRAFLGYACDLTYNFEPSIFGAASNMRTFKWNNATVVEIKGIEYIIGMVGKVNSGGNVGTGVITIAPVSSDYKGLKAKPITIWKATQAWESSDLRSVSLLEAEGTLYVYYSMGGNTFGVTSYEL